MGLFSEVTRKSPNSIFLAMLFGLGAGLCYTLIIPIISRAIESLSSGGNALNDTQQLLGVEVVNYNLAILFTIICGCILLLRSASQIMLTKVSIQLTKELRGRIYKDISKSSLIELENLGIAKVINVIISDVNAIVSGARAIPDLISNSVTIIGMLLFLFFINDEVFLLVLSALFIGIVIYQFMMFFANRYFLKSRMIFDELQESTRGFISGIKDIKLNAEKEKFFLENVLEDREQQILKSNTRAYYIAIASVSYGDLINFLVIGVTAFIFVNYHSINVADLFSIVMILLYIAGPITAVLNAIPEINLSRISYGRLTDIISKIPNENCVQDVKPLPAWNTIEFRNVEFQYDNIGSEQGFKVGPLSFSIKKGEITYLLGGNGSGKSTLSKLITLHYHANQGEILFGNTKVTEDTLVSCRQEICAIYTDYYLFDTFLFKDSVDENLVDEYLKRFKLEGKVKFENGKFSTVKLSDGQRKRLALVVSLIDDKQVYLFDEWAADQDPEFKRIFYEDILPLLKQRGKAVIVISHDQAYFKGFDNLIIMEDGNIKNYSSEGEALEIIHS
ncbi:cyclic peptide export ABC transporter [Pseudoalteromonas luteoviolacea]|uniref:Cyclic peptide transporter n=1 Tax=Pseudoalteromonas luteoviolacea S4060-1 TaxID=1365257 RepID=A0A167NWI3_9GAMM|nr:cyclic peptide export ABC transporter [Pseudoalteromonas luteoviolacea]KZN69020.1 hypothetical protein N478_12620 [Pseudoalteromonas luteoviolacea S4060-1]